MKDHVIVITTINGLTEAIQKFASIEGWSCIVVGDRKTPPARVFEDSQITLIPNEIKAALEAFKPLAREHGIIFTLNFSENSPDPVSGLLAPVIANGLRNAVEAIVIKEQEGGRVDISVNLAGDHLHIRISDNGVGLKPGEQSGTSTPRTTLTSHGIGLELCHRLITSLEGKLTLTTIPDHDGAQLTIEVPLRSLGSA